MNRHRQTEIDRDPQRHTETNTDTRTHTQTTQTTQTHRNNKDKDKHSYTLTLLQANALHEKNPCEPVRTGAHQIPDARDDTMESSRQFSMLHLGHRAHFLVIISLCLFYRNCNMKQQPTRDPFKVVCMASRWFSKV